MVGAAKLIKMPFYQYGHYFHSGDKVILQPSYLYSWIPSAFMTRFHIKKAPVLPLLSAESKQSVILFQKNNLYLYHSVVKLILKPLFWRRVFYYSYSGDQCLLSIIGHQGPLKARSNITWNYIQHCNDLVENRAWLWTQNLHSISPPCRRHMEWLLFVFERKLYCPCRWDMGCLLYVFERKLYCPCRQDMVSLLYWK